MKKTTLLLVLAFLLLACTGAAAQTQTTTILMYMCGTDLQEACVQDLYEMSQVSMPDEVRVMIQAGGAKQWADGDLTPNKLNRFEIHSGEWLNMQVLPHASMGDYQTLLDFIDWGVSSAPADRYMLVLWDHGGGSADGVCFDETANNDSLSIHEISDALHSYVYEHQGFQLDIIGCDACLMSSYELASHMRWYADYMLSSEELEPGNGWDYTGLLSALCEDPAIDTQSLCIAGADIFMQSSMADDPNNYLSQSVIYLPAMEPLVKQMESYAAYLCQALDNGQLATFSRSRQRMYSFGSYCDHATDMVDFMAFLDATRQFAPNTAARVEAAYQKAVRYSVGTNTFDYLTGLSILMPMSNNSNLELYACDECIPSYSEFAVGMQALLRGGSYSFNVQTPDQLDSELASQAVFNSSMQSTVFVPGGTYVAQEEEPAPEEEEEDVTAGLPEVQSGVAGMDDVVVGAVSPSGNPPTFLTPFNPAQIASGGTDSTAPQEPAEEGAEQPVYACAMTLGADELANLSLVEGMLYIDGSDEEATFYIGLGAMQNAGVNWETGEIVSEFDGTWPMLDEQMAVLYDQIVTEGVRRSIIPVRCNGKEGYLLLFFNAAHPEGLITGFTEGMSEAGIPQRTGTRLAPGDEVIPLYPLIYYDEDGERQEATFDGDPILVGEEGTIPFSFESLLGSDSAYTYCFRLTDIYGET
ncbi:MAG: clostripain-related cysteine peptidase, partial [Eubacteriales bacterium]|nr:clostripain-related cysteine peptidase [Eubacteriales bacterium]